MKSIFWTAWILILSTHAAFAKSETVISQVELIKAADHVEYVFHLNEAIEASALSARIDDSLIVLSLANATAKRTWIPSANTEVRRILLHPFRAKPGAALRIRYFKSVSRSILENIRVRAEGSRLIAAIPNNANVAQSWAKHARRAIVATPKTEEAATLTQNTAKTPVETANNVKDTIDEDAIAIAPMPETKADQLDDDSAAKVSERVDDEAGMAATERSNTPTLIVALLMMIGVGFVLFKKMRQMKPSNEGGPLIRPIGTHMLGPKQGLLLVDVAGERVLLGTTDKGVHLLTKLETTNTETTETQYEGLTEVRSTDSEKSQENPFGKMLGQFREASTRLRGMTQTGGGQAQGSSTGGTDDLSMLAEEQPAYDRRLKRPVTPRVPVPPYETQTSIQERDALIEKLRMLKGA